MCPRFTKERVGGGGGGNTPRLARLPKTPVLIGLTIIIKNQTKSVLFMFNSTHLKTHVVGRRPFLQPCKFGERSTDHVCLGL